MKRTAFLPLATLTLLAVLAVTGCRTKAPKNITPIPVSPTTVAPRVGETDPTRLPTGNPPTPPPQPPITLPPGNPGNPNNLVRPENITPPPTTFPTNPPIPFNPNDNLPPVEMKGDRIVDRTAFAASTIHFDYDKAVVKASELGKLQPVIAALKAHPKNNLEVEGHCDERGTEEYNRALSERRALAIRAQLIKSGIAPGRISTTGFGEDKPAALGHDEAAWAKNRRGELLLLKPKN